MPSLSITDYIIAALLLALLGLGIYAKTIDTELTLKTAQYDKFVSDTKAVGLQQELENTKTQTELANAAVKIQEDLNAKTTDLNNLYAEYNRLRHSTSTSSSKASNLSEAASKLSCPSAETKLSGALEYLEAGILEAFVKPLDAALIRNESCKEYLDESSTILGTGK